jgi:hypothetical protein
MAKQLNSNDKLIIPYGQILMSLELEEKSKNIVNENFDFFFIENDL